MKQKLQKSRRIQGFTLVELLITLAIASILLAYGIPSYRRFSLRQTLSNEANNFIGDLNFARAKAINENFKVKVTSNNGNNWEDGWSIALDTTPASPNLRVKQETPKDITMAGSTGVITFSSIGGLPATAGGPINVVFSHADYPNYITVTISMSGSISSSRGL